MRLQAFSAVGGEMNPHDLRKMVTRVALQRLRVAMAYQTQMETSFCVPFQGVEPLRCAVIADAQDGAWLRTASAMASVGRF